MVSAGVMGTKVDFLAPLMFNRPTVFLFSKRFAGSAPKCEIFRAGRRY